MEKHQIIFKGLLPSALQKDTEEKFASLFKITPEKAAAILAKPNTILRKDLDIKAATLYRDRLTSIGLNVLIRAIPVASEEVSSDSKTVDNKTISENILRKSPVVEKIKVPRELTFKFHGSGLEYFRIWIVNVLLTLVTLGIYSAWAKVRTQQYFHGNTELDGASFRYLATAKQILRGRLIAAAIFIVYFGLQHISMKVQGAGTFLLILAAPALLVLSLSFRLRYSAWRNVHFGFTRHFGRAYRIMAIPMAILILMFASIYMASLTGSQPAKKPDIHKMIPFFASTILFCISFPWIEFLYNQFIVTNAMYGSRHFGFSTKVSGYYKMYGLTVLQVFLMGFISAIVAPIFGKIMRDPNINLPKIFSGFPLLLMIPAWLWVIAFMQARRFNMRYNGMSLGKNQFICKVSAIKYMWLYLGNTIAIIISVGLLIPWAQIRTINYRLSCLTLVASDDMDNFIDRPQDSTATGAELGGFFDVDVAM